MREAAQSPYETCVYCKQPITEEIARIKRLEDGSAAHIICYLAHLDDEDNERGR
ncbi:MAG TPA: hypothetical protein VGS27_34090 [Candidatus Sulfotelmatobacter sp.]|nr:hypothetical protein [Candidatus Sulfotelmatobacter sp.]